MADLYLKALESERRKLWAECRLKGLPKGKVKVKIAAGDRSEFEELATQLAEATDAALVQTIGRIAVLYREAEEPTIKLP